MGVFLLIGFGFVVAHESITPHLLLKQVHLWLTFFFPFRHRLEEGQASSWSRRLKFFMCCTRAQDTQSVSQKLLESFFAIGLKREKTKSNS